MDASVEPRQSRQEVSALKIFSREFYKHIRHDDTHGGRVIVQVHNTQITKSELVCNTN